MRFVPMIKCSATSRPVIFSEKDEDYADIFSGQVELTVFNTSGRVEPQHFAWLFIKLSASGSQRN